MARIVIVDAAGVLVLPAQAEARQVEREASTLARITDPYARQMVADAIRRETLARRRRQP